MTDNAFHISTRTDMDDATITVNQMHGFMYILVQPDYDSSVSLGLDSSRARLIADALYEAARRADQSLADYTRSIA